VTDCQFWIQTRVQIAAIVATLILAARPIWGDVTGIVMRGADKGHPRSHRRSHSHVFAGLLRVWLCSVVLGGAKCNGRHAEFVNKIKAQFSCVLTTNQGVGSSNFSGRANWFKYLTRRRAVQFTERS